MTGPDVVLAVWQQVNGRELSDQRKAEFLAHSALDDLTAFSAEILAETGRRLHDEHGELLLTAWAAECAEPGLTGLPPSGELGLSLAKPQGWSVPWSRRWRARFARTATGLSCSAA